MTSPDETAPIAGKRARRDDAAGRAGRRRSTRRVRQATRAEVGATSTALRTGGRSDGLVSAPAREPDWWHRSHPVFTRLAGFFTGLLVAVLVPTVFGALLAKVVGYDNAEAYFPWVLVVFVVPLVLIAIPRTRRYGLYFLIGLIATLVVAIAAALVTLLILTGGSLDPNSIGGSAL